MDEIYTPEQNQKPDTHQLRRTQLAYNKSLALLAVEERWHTAQIKDARNEMKVFWIQP